MQRLLKLLQLPLLGGHKCANGEIILETYLFSWQVNEMLLKICIDRKIR
jgi:hypothetical protein